MFNYQKLRMDGAGLCVYADLLRRCFPRASHLTEDYLRWLYLDNPYGAAIGTDAWYGDRLVAHYACIPTKVVVLGRDIDAVLSLNTATHPEFRGKGLFTKLAELTYRSAADNGYQIVYGVANGNSTPGFVRKLGFRLVRQLDAQLGFGRQLAINWDQVLETAEFRRHWDQKSLAWRIANPSNPVSLVSKGHNCTRIYAKTGSHGVIVWGEVPVAAIPHARNRDPGILRPRLFLGLVPDMAGCRRVSVQIPKKLRPSPLNFIVRALSGAETIDPTLVSFSFADFDAY